MVTRRDAGFSTRAPQRSGESRAGNTSVLIIEADVTAVTSPTGNVTQNSNRVPLDGLRHVLLVSAKHLGKRYPSPRRRLSIPRRTRRMKRFNKVGVP